MSSVARVAVEKFSNLVLGNELAAKLLLIGRQLIIHLIYELAGPDVLFGRSMAIEAPLHVKCRGLGNERHLVHASVAARASNAFIDMNAVIEINKPGQIMDAVPRDGLSRPVTRADRLEHRAVNPDLGVTAHAGVCRRNPGKRTRLDRCMTVPAVNAELAGVVLMAKLDRLFSRYTYVRGVPGAFEGHNQPDPSSCQQEDHSEADQSNRIRRTRKYLGHLSPVPLPALTPPA